MRTKTKPPSPSCKECLYFDTYFGCMGGEDDPCEMDSLVDPCDKAYEEYRDAEMLKGGKDENPNF